MIGVGPVAVWACGPIDLSLPRADVPGDWWNRRYPAPPCLSRQPANRGIRHHPASVGNLRSRSLPTLCIGCNLCRPPEINVDVGFGPRWLRTVPLKA
jgi:hypothetical protein